TLPVPERKPGTTKVEPFASPAKILQVGLCQYAKIRRKKIHRGAHKKRAGSRRNGPLHNHAELPARNEL
ncbi:MAG: hypothetical protein J6Y92_04730, partial [Lentisphaeria bacterium]|nr:hypothetical protein [Lentisphaeria bacterium]